MGIDYMAMAAWGIQVFPEGDSPEAEEEWLTEFCEGSPKGVGYIQVGSSYNSEPFECVVGFCGSSDYGLETWEPPGAFEKKQFRIWLSDNHPEIDLSECRSFVGLLIY